MSVDQLNKSSEWGDFAEPILKLYGEEKWTLPRILEYMRKKHGLKKSLRQYRTLLKKNNVTKYHSAATWVFAKHLIEARKPRKSELLIRGEPVAQARLERNTLRYANKDLSLIDFSTFDYIIVRTPPGSPQLRNNPSETLGDGHLEQLDEVFEDSSNTHLRLFDVNRPKTPRRQQLELESISVPEEQWERKSISVPEDAMDNDDYGNLDTLTAKAREWNLKGLGWIEIVDEGKQPVIETGHPFRSSHPNSTSRLPLPGSIHHTWDWESLRVMLGAFVESKAGLEVAHRIHCHPQNATFLSDYKEQDLLNFAISVSLHTLESSIALKDLGRKLQTWLSLPGPNKLLNYALSTLSTQRAKRLSFSLIGQSILTFADGQNVEDYKAAIVSSFQCLLDMGDADLSQDDVDRLCRAALMWALPGIVRRALKLRQHRKCRPTNLGGLFTNGDVMWTRAGQSQRTVAMLLEHGAPPGSGLVHAIDGYVQASKLGKDRGSAESWILMLLSHRADPNMIVPTTFPLTVTEYGVSQCPEMASFLEDWIKEPTSQEIIEIYKGLSDLHAMSDSSILAREIVLLAAARNIAGNLDLLKKLLESGTNPDVPSLCPSIKDESVAVDDAETHAETFRHDLWKSTRPVFEPCGEIIRPINEAFRRGDPAMLSALLKAGSLPPSRLLGPVKSVAVLPSPPLTTDKGEVSCLNDVMKELLNSRHFDRMCRALMQYAVEEENAKLIRQLIDKKVGLSQCSVIGCSNSGIYEEWNPFLHAVIRSSLRFAKEVWRLHPWFLDAKDQGYGARELVVFFDCIDPTQPEFEQKAEFLLSLGAEVNAHYRGNRTCAMTPLQAAMSAEGPDPSASAKCRGENEHMSAKAKICELLVSRGADVNATGSDCATPLQLATFYGDFRMTDLLLKNRADANDVRYAPEQTVSYGRNSMSSPLSMACRTMSCSCLEVSEGMGSVGHTCQRSLAVHSLLAAGASVDHMPAQGDSAIIEACRTGCYRTLSLLLCERPSLHHQSRSGRNPVEISCERPCSASADICFSLCAFGYGIPKNNAIDDILLRSLISQDKDMFQARALHLERNRDLFDAVAAEDYSLSRVARLVEAGADVNCRQPQGLTPLLNAAISGNFSATLHLIENGADVCATDDAGNSALSIAVGRCLYNIVHLLLNAGAKRLMRGESYECALGLAKSANPAVIELLEPSAGPEDVEEPFGLVVAKDEAAQSD